MELQRSVTADHYRFKWDRPLVTILLRWAVIQRYYLYGKLTGPANFWFARSRHDCGRAKRMGASISLRSPAKIPGRCPCPCPTPNPSLFYGRQARIRAAYRGDTDF